MVSHSTGQFFQQGKLSIKPSPKGLLATFGGENLVPISETRRALCQALLDPEDFPALPSAVVQGDRVAIAVASSLPQADQCVAGVLDALPADESLEIDVLLTEDTDDRMLQAVTQIVAGRAQVHRHQPDEQDTLGYLAAAQSADPIYLNRVLIEAGLVIPLLVASPPEYVNPITNAGGVFPMFADRRSQLRVADQFWKHRESSRRPPSHPPKQSADDSIEAEWLLGLQLAVAILPTVDASAAQIVAGTPAGIQRRLATASRDAWACHLENVPSLIVAVIDGDPEQQTWNNIARSVYTASQLASPGATIAVCSRVSAKPGKAMGMLALDEPFESVLQRLRKSRSSDTLAAMTIYRIAQQHRIVIGSQVRSETIEDLGLGVIENIASLQRLVDQHESCLVLRAAQYCSPKQVHRGKIPC